MVSLATSFEMLVTGHYTLGVAERIRRRAALLTGDAKAAQAVMDVYEARSGIVHFGKPLSESLQISTAQRAYLHCLEAIAAQLASVTAREDDPLRRITGDTELESEE